jgi:hypothetical protein
MPESERNWRLRRWGVEERPRARRGERDAGEGEEPMAAAADAGEGDGG